MVLSWGKSLQRRLLNLLVDKTVFLTLLGFLTLIVISITWLGEKWIVVSSNLNHTVSFPDEMFFEHNSQLNMDNLVLIDVLYRSAGVVTNTGIYSILFPIIW